MGLRTYPKSKSDKYRQKGAKEAERGEEEEGPTTSHASRIHTAPRADPRTAPLWTDRDATLRVRGGNDREDIEGDQGRQTKQGGRRVPCKYATNGPHFLCGDTAGVMGGSWEDWSIPEGESGRDDMPSLQKWGLNMTQPSTGQCNYCRTS